MENKVDEIMVRLDVAEVELCFHALIAAADPPTSPTLATAMLALAARMRYRKQFAIDCHCEQQVYAADVVQSCR
jgi:hypothetical protein